MHWLSRVDTPILPRTRSSLSLHEQLSILVDKRHWHQPAWRALRNVIEKFHFLNSASIRQLRCINCLPYEPLPKIEWIGYFICSSAALKRDKNENCTSRVWCGAVHTVSPSIFSQNHRLGMTARQSSFTSWRSVLTPPSNPPQPDCEQKWRKIGKNNFHKIKNHQKFVFCLAYHHKVGSILHLSVLRQFFCRLIRNTIIFGAKKIFLLTFPLLCYHCCIFCCRFNFGSDVEKLPHCCEWTADEAGKFSCWRLHAPFLADAIKLIDFEPNVRSMR